MCWFIGTIVIISTVIVRMGYAQEVPRVFEGRVSLISVAANLDQRESGIVSQFPGVETGETTSNQIPNPSRDVARRRIDLSRFQPNFEHTNTIIRGQSPGGSGGGGAGASAATDPSAILTQFQIQNVFTPSTYDASGYSNTLILQPVLPFPVAMPGLKEIFPSHIMRPTLPIISPSADPDGSAGVEGGLGDLTLLMHTSTRSKVLEP